MKRKPRVATPGLLFGNHGAEHPQHTESTARTQDQSNRLPILAADVSRSALTMAERAP